MKNVIHTDHQLIRLLSEGSEAAFGDLYNRYWERMYLSASKKLADKELAKEIVHDIFLDLWRRRETLQIEHLPAYLDQAVRFRVLNALVKKKDVFFFDILESPLQSLDGADAGLIEKDLNALIAAWIEVLPEKRREIFVRYFFRHLTPDEIAEDLQISKKTVQNQLSISFQYLRSRFGHMLALVILLEQMHRD